MYNPEKPLVSILTSVYNGEQFVEEYMQAVMGQTYPNIELIIVNDGSTDDSEKNILSYREKLEARGIQFCYVSKSNGGHPSGINAGLKYVNGKYLTWPDIDDRMHPDYIEYKVNFLEKESDAGYLITRSAIIDIKQPNVCLGYTWSNRPTSKEDIWNRIIENTGYSYEAGNFFVRMSEFRRVHPTMQIYDGCGRWSGPQVQMMLPMIYGTSYAYSEAVLFDYCVHDNNDHNKYKSKEDLYRKCRAAQNVWEATIEGLVDMQDEEKKKWLACVNRRLTREELAIASSFRDYQWFKQTLMRLSIHDITWKHIAKLIIFKWIASKE